MTIGIFAVAIYMVIGICMGAVAGYYGGRVDILIQRFIEVVMSIPSFFLILTMAAFIENRSIFHIMLIIALVRWTGVAREGKSSFLSIFMRMAQPERIIVPPLSLILTKTRVE